MAKCSEFPVVQSYEIKQFFGLIIIAFTIAAVIVLSTALIVAKLIMRSIGHHVNVYYPTSLIFVTVE